MVCSEMFTENASLDITRQTGLCCFFGTLKSYHWTWCEFYPVGIAGV